MKRFCGGGVLVIGLVWLAAGVGCVYAADGGENPDKAETVVIPLDQIWALDMPGTRDAKELDESLVEEAQRAIGHSTPDNQETKAAFAVLGTREDALCAAHSVFTSKSFAENIKRRKTFPENSDVSVVFFSAEFNRYVHIDRVERQDKVISIHYRFVPNKTKEYTKHLALIPLGKLPPGKYRVKMIRSPMEQKYLDQVWRPVLYEDTFRIVGNSFSFFVGEQSAADQGPNEVGGEIYLDEIWAKDMPGTINVRELEPSKFGPAVRQLPQNQQTQFLLNSLQHQIFLAILPDSYTKKPMNPGFVVESQGEDALEEILEVLKKNDFSQPPISTRSEATLFFYGDQGGGHLHLKNVYRSKNKIVVRFQFVHRMAMMLTQHFALIPLGRLPAGKYTVVMEAVPSEIGKYTPELDIQEQRKFHVCRDFEFEVID